MGLEFLPQAQELCRCMAGSPARAACSPGAVTCSKFRPHKHTVGNLSLLLSLYGLGGKKA